jgi:hypothetical protein
MNVQQHSNRGSTNWRTIVLVALAALLSVAGVMGWNALKSSATRERESLRGAISMNNLHMIGLAVSQQEQKMQEEKLKGGSLAAGRLSKGLTKEQVQEAQMIMGLTAPPAICNPDGKPLLSWRVAILPYIEQEALYERFHLDEPWDSPHNSQLIAEIPEVLCSPGRPNDGKTLYLECVGEETPFPSHSAPAVNRLRLGGNVVRIVEVDEEDAVPWTQPADLILKPGEPVSGVGKLRQGKFLAAMFDGSVQSVPADAPPLAIRQLFTREGGVIPDPISQLGE